MGEGVKRLESECSLPSPPALKVSPYAAYLLLYSHPARAEAERECRDRDGAAGRQAESIQMRPTAR